MLARSPCTLLVAAGYVAAHVIGNAPGSSMISSPREAQVNTAPGHFGMSLKKRNINGTTSSGVQSRDEWGAHINANWLASLNIGTPPQTLDLLLDLGSDGFVVESDLLPPEWQTTKFPIYHPGKSTTSRRLDGYSWLYAYGGATLEGDIYNDVITMGDQAWKNFSMEVVTGQPVGTPVQ